MRHHEVAKESTRGMDTTLNNTISSKEGTEYLHLSACMVYHHEGDKHYLHSETFLEKSK
tara:strand:+ start:1563 stop:1739 length:177 start_codon:yes stop_codon:yes gene_type:complete